MTDPSAPTGLICKSFLQKVHQVDQCNWIHGHHLSPAKGIRGLKHTLSLLTCCSASMVPQKHYAKVLLSLSNSKLIKFILTRFPLGHNTFSGSHHCLRAHTGILTPCQLPLGNLLSHYNLDLCLCLLICYRFHNAEVAFLDWWAVLYTHTHAHTHITSVSYVLPCSHQDCRRMQTLGGRYWAQSPSLLPVPPLMPRLGHHWTWISLVRVSFL